MVSDSRTMERPAALILLLLTLAATLGYLLLFRAARRLAVTNA